MRISTESPAGRTISAATTKRVGFSRRVLARRSSLRIGSFTRLKVRRDRFGFSSGGRKREVSKDLRSEIKHREQYGELWVEQIGLALVGESCERGLPRGCDVARIFAPLKCGEGGGGEEDGLAFFQVEVGGVEVVKGGEEFEAELGGVEESGVGDCEVDAGDGLAVVGVVFGGFGDGEGGGGNCQCRGCGGR